MVMRCTSYSEPETKTFSSLLLLINILVLLSIRWFDFPSSVHQLGGKLSIIIAIINACFTYTYIDAHTHTFKGSKVLGQHLCFLPL